MEVSAGEIPADVTSGRGGVEVEGPFQAHEPRAVVETQISNEGTEAHEAARSPNTLSGCLSTLPQVTPI